MRCARPFIATSKSLEHPSPAESAPIGRAVIPITRRF
jgi:hypothetical protein